MTRPGAGPDRVAQALADPRRAVWRLALPILAGIGVQTLYNLTDMAFVGRLGGASVTALTFSMPLIFLATGVAFGLGAGATSAVARHLGAGDRPGAGHAAEHAILLALAVGLGTAAAAIAFQVELFGALGARDEPLRLATRYFGILAPGFVIVLLNGTFHAILAGEGDTRTPVALQGSGTLLNIGLDPVFIFAAGMGIRGAAVATVVSQALVCLAFLIHLFVRRGSYVEFRFREFRPRAATAAGLLRVGLPSSASMVLMAAGGMFYNRIVSAFGPDAVAGLGVGGRLDAVFFLPVIALATSMVTVVGMFLGAGRVDLIRSTVGYALSRSVALRRGHRRPVLDLRAAAGRPLHHGAGHRRRRRRLHPRPHLGLPLHRRGHRLGQRLPGAGQRPARPGADLAPRAADLGAPGLDPDAGLPPRTGDGVALLRRLGAAHLLRRPGVDAPASAGGGEEGEEATWVGPE